MFLSVWTFFCLKIETIIRVAIEGEWRSVIIWHRLVQGPVHLVLICWPDHVHIVNDLDHFMRFITAVAFIALVWIAGLEAIGWVLWESACHDFLLADLAGGLVDATHAVKDLILGRSIHDLGERLMERVLWVHLRLHCRYLHVRTFDFLLVPHIVLILLIDDVFGRGLPCWEQLPLLKRFGLHLIRLHGSFDDYI